MISKDEIILAYNLFLGRDPENADVINNLSQNIHSLAQLRETFLNSAEFRQRISETLAIPSHFRHRHPFTLPNMPVETDVSHSELDQMFERIHQEWETLGEKDPYWSVVTQPQYHLDQIPSHLEQFYHSGKYISDIFLSSLRRNGLNQNQLKTCLEFGCGVGRVTPYLAASFDKIIAVDISKNHIEIGKKYIESQGIQNIQFEQIQNLSLISFFPKVDTILSVITLQHNPPPLIAWMLKELLNCLNPGGVAYIQIPTYRSGYLFEVKRYLNTPASQSLEMHFMPQSHIFRLIQESNCQCLEVREDSMVGDEDKMLSNTFLIQKM